MNATNSGAIKLLAGEERGRANESIGSETWIEHFTDEQYLKEDSKGKV